MQLNRTQCCGLRELHGIQDLNFTEYPAKPHSAPEILKFVVAQMKAPHHKKGAFVTFAAAERYHPTDRIGLELAEMIEEYGLGDLVTHPPTRNPNSGNMLQVWLWRVNWAKLSKFGTKKEPKPKAKAKSKKK